MVKVQCVDEYYRLRDMGWGATAAWRAAQINTRFEERENAGIMRLLTAEESEGYDASYVDTWTDLSTFRREKWKASILDRVNREGVYCITSYVWDSPTVSYLPVDSCGGFIGDDWKDSGYDTDIKLSALEEYDRRHAIKKESLQRKDVLQAS